MVIVSWSRSCLGSFFGDPFSSFWRCYRLFRIYCPCFLQNFLLRRQYCCCRLTCCPRFMVKSVYQLLFQRSWQWISTNWYSCPLFPYRNDFWCIVTLRNTFQSQSGLLATLLCSQWSPFNCVWRSAASVNQGSWSSIHRWALYPCLKSGNPFFIWGKTCCNRSDMCNLFCCRYFSLLLVL